MSRKRQKIWGLLFIPIILSLLWLTGFVATVSSATQPTEAFTVDTTNDTHDAIPGNGRCQDASGKCSLRAAIEESNILNGPNWVNLPNGNYISSLFYLVITDTLTINGEAMTSTVVDVIGGQFYLINPSAQIAVTITNITIENGGGTEGDGIYVRENLLLSDCIIQDNSATRGGGIYVHAEGSLLVDTCYFEHNIASQGGAIYSAGDTTILDSTFFGNYADEGGAIYNMGKLMVLNSTISGNIISKSGGGIHSVSTLPASISHSTVVNNIADANGIGWGDGGGIFSDGSLLIQDTIIANNIDGTGEAPDCGGALVSNGYNLIKDLSGCAITLLPSDLFGMDPLLGPLANNGGTTLTHALLAGSPAIDAGNCTDPDGNPVPFDQRGMPRPQGVTCDMGAYEFGFRLYLPIIIR